MGGAIGSLENFLSTADFNEIDFLKLGKVDSCILTILRLQRPAYGGSELVLLIPQGGTALVPIIPLVDAVKVLLILLSLILLGDAVEVTLIPL